MAVHCALPQGVQLRFAELACEFIRIKAGFRLQATSLFEGRKGWEYVTVVLPAVLVTDIIAVLVATTQEVLVVAEHPICLYKSECSGTCCSKIVIVPLPPVSVPYHMLGWQDPWTSTRVIPAAIPHALLTLCWKVFLCALAKDRLVLFAFEADDNNASVAGADIALSVCATVK